MKITHARTHVLEAKLSQSFACSRAWYDSRTAMLARFAVNQVWIGRS